MPILKIPGLTLLFVHIPKTGGSSVEAYLARKGPVSLRWRRHVAGFDTPPQHFHRDLLDRLFAPSFFDASFAILRDPLERLISEFRYRASPPKPVHGLYGLRDLRGRGRFTVAGRRRTLDLDGWTRAVFAAYRRDPALLSNHIRPQSQFLGGNEVLFRLEGGLTPVWRWIDAITDTPPDLDAPHEKRSAYPRPVPAAETVERVRAFYREDYELLSSLSPSPPPLPSPGSRAPARSLAHAAP